MAGTDLTIISSFLKTKYGPAVKSQLNDETEFRNEFTADKSQTWTGEEVSYPVHVNRNRAVMAAGAEGKLPTAGAQKMEKWHIPLRYVYGRAQFTGPAIKLSESNEGAFARVMSLEMDRLVVDLAMQFEFYYSGYGTGVRALVNGDPSTGTTITVDAPMGIAGSTHGNRYINDGDYVAFVSPGGTLRAGGSRLVNYINPDGTTFGISAAADAAVADNDYVVKAYGSDASLTIDNTEYMHPPMGVLGLLDDGTYRANIHGISRDQYPIMRTPVISTVGALSLDVIQRGLDLASQLGQAKIGAFWCHHSVRRAYLALLEADRRYTGSDLRNPDGGTKVAKGGEITYGGIPFKTASQFPYGFLVGMDKRHSTRFVNTEGEWIDEDGNVLSRVSDYDAFECAYRVFENAHYERPNAAIRWDGITASVVVAHIV